MDAISRLVGFALYCAACVIMVAMLVSVIPDMETAYTARFNERQRQETARYLAGQETARAWAAQTGDTARTMAMWGTVAAVAIVAAVQAGRTFRHQATQRTEERRILMLYAAQYLPRANVSVQVVEGELTLLNHDERKLIPLHNAERALMARGLLVDSRR